MREVEPSVRLIAKPELDWGEIKSYLDEVGGMEWYDRITVSQPTDPGAEIVEFAGRLCYRSWAPGLNANVSKVRTDSADYLENVLKSGHGSVIEHANFTFLFHNVSRVFTHEVVRHRAGCAYSQESMRFVRLTDIPFWFPEWCKGDETFMERAVKLLADMEDFQTWMADHFGLDAMKQCGDCRGEGEVNDPPDIALPTDFMPRVVCPKCNGTGQVPAIPFSQKKAKTSFMRRFAPDGVATGIVMTANVRALRHIISMRTDPAAEEEIRLVFGEVARIMVSECPLLFQDFSEREGGWWCPKHWKV